MASDAQPTTERSEPGAGSRPAVQTRGSQRMMSTKGIAKVTSPEEFFGFKMGTDRKMARWDKIVEYFRRLETESDKIKVMDMGPSTEGNPFLLTVISSAENLRKLDHYKAINAKITDPRGLSEEAVKELVREGKAVVCQSMSLHATEIGGTQMAPELAWDLLACDCADNRAILDNVIFLMVPCFNPDGQIMVTDWYNKWLGTEYEGTGTPFLYQKYAGHDNNRDAFALNLPESRYVAQILYTEWHPHAYQDHHHMGSTGARLFLAPYSDAIRPNADPLVWREDSWYGAHMAYTLEEQGKTGILNGAQYPGWGHFGFHWITTHHNIAGMLTESASAKLATPVYIHPHQLKGASAKTMPKYEAQTNFPHPWPGGWWRLRDIVEQQKISAWALLDICAKYREKVLWNAYLKAKRQTERGAEAKPYAYAVNPLCNNDPLTALKLIDLLRLQGIEVKRSAEGFEADGRVFAAGTYVVFCDQPKMGVIRGLLNRTFYPDSYWTRNPDGSPIMYDTATDTVAEFMGVDVAPIESKVEGQFDVVTTVKMTAPEVKPAPAYILDPRLNDSFTAANKLMDAGVKVWRLDDPYQAQGICPLCCYPAGAIYVEGGPEAAAAVRSVSREVNVPLRALEAALNVPKREMKRRRIGMYQRYWGGNMDEGWTRLVLEKFGFPYVTLKDADFKDGKLNDKVDVIILPADRTQMIMGPDAAAEKEARSKGWPIPPTPPEFRSGLGKEGAGSLKEFVKNGGRLIALDTSSDFAIETFDLKVRNVVANAAWKDFYCHGSTLRVKVQTGNSLGYGMPEDALVLNMGSPTFEITDTFNSDDYEVIAEYRGEDILQSGWVIGEEKIVNKPCMMKVKAGGGDVILFGFRPQFRAQTHGTFKLLFNCLV